MKKFIMSLALAAAVSVPSFAQTTPQQDPTSNPASDKEKMEERLENEGIKMRQKAANMQDGVDRERSVPQSTLPVANRAGEPSDEDFNRMVRNAYNVELRALAGSALDLSEEEIEDFTPLFMDYMKYKNALVERRSSLVTNYREEMAEDDTAKDEANETAGFIENYMEVDIAEMKLKKDYFDKLEDKIGVMKALRFFDLEKQFNSRIQRALLTNGMNDDNRNTDRSSTLFLLIPERYTAYEREMDDYRNWNKVNITGNVNVDHDYTYNGLAKLLTAAEAMNKAEGISVTNFADRKQMVMDKAAMLKKDWTSLEHADYARVAFVETASILNDIANEGNFVVRTEWINKLNMQAKAIKPSVKLTDQAMEVRAFFATAQTIVNDLVDQADGMTK